MTRTSPARRGRCGTSCGRSDRCSASARTPSVPEAELERALREVAVLVARGVAPEEVFTATSEQAARVCGVAPERSCASGSSGAEIVGRWGQPGRGAPVGDELELDGGGALTLVRDTGLPARFDDYASRRGRWGRRATDRVARERGGAGLVEGASGAR